MKKAYKGLWITLAPTALITILFGYRIFGIKIIFTTIILYGLVGLILSGIIKALLCVSLKRKAKKGKFENAK